MTTRQFIHDNKIFEIREVNLSDRYAVKVFLNGSQISPEYSATLEIGQDYFSQHQARIIDVLVSIAEEDIRNGFYLGK